VQDVAGQFSAASAAGKPVSVWFGSAQEQLKLCDSRLATKDYGAAYIQAERAMQALRLVERACWEYAVDSFADKTGLAAAPVQKTPVSRSSAPAAPSPSSATTIPFTQIPASPGLTSFYTLPWHNILMDRVTSSRLGQNKLPGGDFEDLDALMRAGWRHLQTPSSGIETAAELSVNAAHSGRTGLRMVSKMSAAGSETAKPADSKMKALAGIKTAGPPAILESPPQWITSPNVPVEAGQLVLIRGWVNVAAPISSSEDGLMIFDSLGGEDLSLRIKKTAGWQPFGLFRAASQSGPMNVTFVLTGLGEIMLDEVSIQVVEPLNTPRSSPLAPGSG
jgi:hypothetical protein